MMITATEAARSAAHIHWVRVTGRPVLRALTGSAKSNAVTSSACTNNTEPNPSAAACRPKPNADTKLPSHHCRSASNRVNSSQCPTT